MSIKEKFVTASQEAINVQAEVSFQPALSIAHDNMIDFYNGNDCATLQNSNIQRVRELQDENDKLQRQVAGIDRDVKHSTDALTLLAEKERCLIIIARNTGEILKIQVENEARLRRIMELEAENMRLKDVVVAQRDNFIDTHEMTSRTKHASEFFLTKSKIEKNSLELMDLTRE